jgi:hypothetical protein
VWRHFIKVLTLLRLSGQNARSHGPMASRRDEPGIHEDEPALTAHRKQSRAVDAELAGGPWRAHDMSYDQSLLPAPSRTARTQPMYDWERECGAHHGPITRGHVVRNDRDSVPAGVASRLYMRDQGQYRGSFIEPFASMRDWESQCGAHHGPLTRRGASRYYSVPAVSVGRARSCTGGTCRHPRWYL